MAQNLVDAIVDRAGRCSSLADVERCWAYDPQTAVIDFKVAGRRAALDVKVDPDVVSMFLIGRGKRLARHFRSVLIGRAPIVTEPGERHLLERWSRRSATARGVVRAADQWIAYLSRGAESTANAFQPDLPLSGDQVSVYWWDRYSNFGDALGPWIVRRLTGRSVVNGMRAAPEARTLASVGSIVGYLSRDCVDIWGSGLQRPLRAPEVERLRSLRDVRVHAVRGELTRRELVDKLGWEVPAILGDPGLLMPRLYQPQLAASDDRVALVAHQWHAAHFRDAHSEDIHCVDVRHSPEQVVDEIASSRVCLSTSLHGIVIAQAYGVPWVWLHVEDSGLRGGRFKYDDFFTVLDRSQVPVVRVQTSRLADVPLVAAVREASLPDCTITLEPLLAAFPRPLAAAGRSA